MAEVVGYDRLEQIRRTASDAPYRIKPGGKGVIVWEVQPGATWKEVATFRKLEDAEVFVFAMCWPVMGEWR